MTTMKQSVCPESRLEGARTVLVADDHRYVRALLEDLIGTSDGFTVVGSAGSAAEAIEGILELRPSIAVVDGELGDGTALDVCRRVRAAGSDTLIVVVSAGVSSWGWPEAEQAGAKGYVIKQVREFSLLETLERLAESRD